MHIEPAGNYYPEPANSHNAAPVRSDMITGIYSSSHNINRHEQGRSLQQLALDMQNRHQLPLIQPATRPWQSGVTGSPRAVTAVPHSATVAAI